MYVHVYENAVKIRISFLVVAIDHLHAFTPLNELQTVKLINLISHKKFDYYIIYFCCIVSLHSKVATKSSERPPSCITKVDLTKLLLQKEKYQGTHHTVWATRKIIEAYDTQSSGYQLLTILWVCLHLWVSGIQPWLLHADLIPIHGHQT